MSNSTAAISEVPAIHDIAKKAKPAQKFTLEIKASKGWVALNFREFWNYRELLYFMAWRNVMVRYKQTLLGVSWAILQPFMTMIVFSIFFGKLGKIPSDGIPYPIFSYCALLPWQLFAHSMTESGNSLVANQHLITKVYFPRLCIPTAPVISGLVDFAVAFIVLIGMMFYYGIYPGWAVVTLPLFVLLAACTSMAVGLWLSAMNAMYRDVRYTIPFLVQLWMFLTPVAYPASIVPENWRWLHGLNPMAGVVEGFRWALLGRTEPPGISLLVSIVMVMVMLVGGLFYFRRMEKYFSDRV
ncbi:MAG TPA: ABC transporter permease [Planctomycetota bacterium]|nr:ABC transporter permease [Planctomycetota bacterium]